MTNDLWILPAEHLTADPFKTEKSLRNSVVTPWCQRILLGISEIHTFLLTDTFCKGSTEFLEFHCLGQHNLLFKFQALGMYEALLLYLCTHNRKVWQNEDWTKLDTQISSLDSSCFLFLKIQGSCNWETWKSSTCLRLCILAHWVVEADKVLCVVTLASVSEGRV